MDYNKNNSLVDESLLQLQTIDKKLSVLMCQYKQSINDYIQSLSNTNKTADEFSKLKGRTFWGTSGIQEGVVDNMNECVNMCLNNTNCSGATYNKQNNYCWVRTGDGIISSADNTTYAIIPIQEKNLKTMKNLNQEIINLQNLKMNIINNMGSSVSILYEENLEKKNQINSMINDLNKEKKLINDMLKETYNLNQEYNDSELIVNSNNLKYNLLWFLFIILVIVIIFIYISKNS